MKILSRKLISFKSETGDELASCSNFSKKHFAEECGMDTAVLPELDYLSGKSTDEQLEAINYVIENYHNVFRNMRTLLGVHSLLNMKKKTEGVDQTEEGGSEVIDPPPQIRFT